MASPFRTTFWSSIHRAKEGRASAINRLVERYREPVVGFIERQGSTREDAEDLAQEVFMILHRDDLLERADASRGRFRSFLLAVTKNVIANARRVRDAAKRGGGTAPASLDAGERPLAELVAARDQDESFDREWIRSIVRQAMERLAGKSERHHRAFQMQMEEHRSYAEIGKALLATPKQVDHLLQQARAMMRDLIREEIAAYCSTKEELSDEVAYLRQFLTA